MRIRWLRKALENIEHEAAYISRENPAAAKEVMRINPKFSVARIQKITPHKDRAVAKRFGDSMRKAGLPD